MPKRAATFGPLALIFLAACVVNPVCYDQTDCSPDQRCNPDTGKCEPSTDPPPPPPPDGGVHPDGDVPPLSCPADMVPIADRFCIDIYEASRPDATLTSAGTDTTHALSQAGVIPWQASSNAQARAACQAAGKDLCTPEEWLTACRGPTQTTYAYGNSYHATTCNGIDLFCYVGPSTACADHSDPFPHCFQSCGAAFKVLPTGELPGCTNAYGVYDINGNLWEHVLGGDDSQVRGGAFNCGDSETFHRCDYVPGNWTPSARGFRCCHTP